MSKMSKNLIFLNFLITLKSPVYNIFTLENFCRKWTFFSVQNFCFYFGHQVKTFIIKRFELVLLSKINLKLQKWGTKKVLASGTTTPVKNGLPDSTLTPKTVIIWELRRRANKDKCERNTRTNFIKNGHDKNWFLVSKIIFSHQKN